MRILRRPHTSSRRQGKHRDARASLARTALRVVSERVGEHVQRAGDEPRRAVGVLASAAVRQLGWSIARGPASPADGRPAGELAEGVRNRAEAVHARAALAGRLRGEVVGDPCRLDHRAGAAAERDDHPGAEARAVLGEMLGRQPQPPRLRRGQPAAEVAADQDGSELVGHAGAVEQLG